MRDPRCPPGRFFPAFEPARDFLPPSADIRDCIFERDPDEQPGECPAPFAIIRLLLAHLPGSFQDRQFDLALVAADARA